MYGTTGLTRERAAPVQAGSRMRAALAVTGALLLVVAAGRRA